MVELEQTHHGIPITTPCSCVLRVDTVRNLERGWVGTLAAEKIESSPLIDLVNQDLFITASDSVLRSHLRFVGLRLGRNWNFLVCSDADLMTAWLYNVAESGGEILDKEVAERIAVSPSRRRTLEDLVDPPGLLVIRLGVKVARNAAMSEVFHEALLRRDHENRPTWVVDQPGHRLNALDALGQQHRSYSELVMEYLQNWNYLDLGGNLEAPVEEELPVGVDSAFPSGPKSFVSFGGGAQSDAPPAQAQARQVKMPEASEPRRGSGRKGKR